MALPSRAKKKEKKKGSAGRAAAKWPSQVSGQAREARAEVCKKREVPEKEVPAN